MNEPRPTVTSARPLEAALSVENRWKTRNRVVRAEHGHGRAEKNAFGAAGDGRKHDLGSRYGEIGAMMLADAKGIDPELIGENRLLDDVADDLRVAQEAAVGAGGDIAERV